MTCIPPRTTARARSLRNDATPEERALWSRLRHVRPRFTRQLPVGDYIVDFACRTVKIAVELDGSQHLDSLVYDARRTRFLEKLGWQVLRFWNSEVRVNADGVVDAIRAAVALHHQPTHPPTPPFREGRAIGS